MVSVVMYEVSVGRPRKSRQEVKKTTIGIASSKPDVKLIKRAAKSRNKTVSLWAHEILIAAAKAELGIVDEPEDGNGRGGD